MMSGRFYIDGKDAFTEYGIYVQEGGYNELVAFPPLKAVTSNDWQEEDGIEPDLSEPTLNTKEFSLKIVLSGMDYRWGGFIERLSDKAYHTFDFREIGRTYRLRLVSNPNTDLATLLGFITVKLADDFPLDGYTYKEPESTVPGSDYYELDGKPFSDYGVRVLEGTLNEIEKSPNVKTSLLRNINKLNGALYDGEKVTYKAKDVKINCLMQAASLTELWRNYNALLYDLVRPEQRLLYSDETGYEYPCHYKSCSVSEFYGSDKIWLKFTITLCFISFRLEDDEFVLATETRDLVVTEDGEFAIDLRKII